MNARESSSNCILRRLRTLDAVLSLLPSADAEGFHFLRRLVDEWTTGLNRFDREGEVLLGCFLGNELVGCGGINRVSGTTARLRRLYVLPKHRQVGYGGLLVGELIKCARPHFDKLELRSLKAGAFYEKLGFSRTGKDNPTHELRLSPAAKTNRQ